VEPLQQLLAVGTAPAMLRNLFEGRIGQFAQDKGRQLLTAGTGGKFHGSGPFKEGFRSLQENPRRVTRQKTDRVNVGVPWKVHHFQRIEPLKMGLAFWAFWRSVWITLPPGFPVPAVSASGREIWPSAQRPA